MRVCMCGCLSVYLFVWLVMRIVVMGFLYQCYEVGDNNNNNGDSNIIDNDPLDVPINSF